MTITQRFMATLAPGTQSDSAVMAALQWLRTNDPKGKGHLVKTPNTHFVFTMSDGSVAILDKATATWSIPQ